MSRVRSLALFLILASLSLGCTQRIDSTYGRARGQSVNGTGVLANLLRQEGHTVRIARRLNERVFSEADTIIRFAPYPGPPDFDEADWYDDWFYDAADHRLIYVCRDYDATAEYWSGAIAQLPDNADPTLKERYQFYQVEAQSWAERLPPPATTPAPADIWFTVDDSATRPSICQRLGGPWSEGVDAEAAALTKRQVLEVTSEDVLLEGDGQPLAMAWSWWGDESDTLVIANGSFLLNATLVNPARRPLAQQVVRWVGPAPRQVVFIEGEALFDESRGMLSPFELLRKLPTLAWIVAHFAVLGLVACLARAILLGRPRPAPPSGADRPVAHAEALGALLARCNDPRTTQEVLESYRRWRHPPAADERTERTTLSSRKQI